MKKLLALGFATSAIATVLLLPWWAGVALLAGLAVSWKALAGTVLKRLFLGAFEAKSAVLRGAHARVHSITAAPEPKRDFDDEFEDDFGSETEIEPGPRSWCYVDVTIELAERKANTASGMAMAMWEPGELMIVEPGARPGKARDLDGFDDDLGLVHSVDVMQGGSWAALDGDKVLGSQRLRLLVGVRPGSDQFKLRYYFEILKNAGPGER